MIYLVKDDVGSQIKAQITREDTNEAADLSGAVVKMYIRKKGTTEILKTLTSISAPSDLEAGIVIFSFGSGDLDLDEGKYEGEIESVIGGTLTETVFETVDLYVRADFT